MAVEEVVTQQGDLVLSGGDQVVIGEPDPIVIFRPVWGGQSPGSIWQEWEMPVTSEVAAVG